MSANFVNSRRFRLQDFSRRRRGFSLVEVTTSLLLFVIVMAVTLSLLFSMRSFAERQTYYTIPRQVARKAVDYVGSFLEGAADLNNAATNPNAWPRNPNALVMYWAAPSVTNLGCGPGCRQASYNNLTSSQSDLGTVGTDIISFAFPQSAVQFPISGWDVVSDPNSPSAYSSFSDTCKAFGTNSAADDASMIQAFKNQIGWDSTTSRSALMTITDPTGRWVYVVVNGVDAGSKCDGTLSKQTERVRFTFIGDSTAQINHWDSVNDTSVRPTASLDCSSFDSNPCLLLAGVSYMSFRHRTRTYPSANPPRPPEVFLDQKMGLFDPAVDTVSSAGVIDAGSTFVPILENVEDFQVAYLFANGQLWNTGAQVLTTDNAVPEQPVGAVDCSAVGDVRCVVGMRVTMTGRSNALPVSSLNQSDLQITTGVGAHRRPAAEDRAQGALDNTTNFAFDRYRLSTTFLIRNRLLGG